MKNKQKTLKVATFNLLNLALANRPFYGKQQYSTEEFEQKKVWINQQLNQLDADIIGFQELFDKAALEDIIQSNSLYQSAHLYMSDCRGGAPAVALLSKFPLKNIEIFPTFPDQLDIDGLQVPFEHFSRPVLSATATLDTGLDIKIFVAHLKSKRPLIPEGVDRHDPIEQSKGAARSLLMRATESNALRTILVKSLRHNIVPHIVLGDFNDTHTSVTTQIISGQKPPRNWPIKHKKKAWDLVLYHAKDIQARQSQRDTYYTHIHNGHYESLDHILVSQELVRENPKNIGKIVYVRVFNDHLLDATFTDEKIPCWQSDHAQVLAVIELKS